MPKTTDYDLVAEDTIEIDNQRSITLAQHTNGAVTIAVEDPVSVAVVEVPRKELWELTQLLVRIQHVEPVA